LQASSDCSGLFGVIAGIRQDTNYYIWAVGLLTWLVSPVSGRLPEKSTLGVRYWYRCPLGFSPPYNPEIRTIAQQVMGLYSMGRRHDTFVMACTSNSCDRLSGMERRSRVTNVMAFDVQNVLDHSAMLFVFGANHIVPMIGPCPSLSRPSQHLYPKTDLRPVFSHPTQCKQLDRFFFVGGAHH